MTVYKSYRKKLGKNLLVGLFSGGGSGGGRPDSKSTLSRLRPSLDTEAGAVVSLIPITLEGLDRGFLYSGAPLNVQNQQK